MYCSACHYKGGPGTGAFTISGTVYQSALTAVNPNTTIQLSTLPNGYGDVVAEIQVDGFGNFYSTTASIDWGSGGLYATVIGNTETMHMGNPVTQGNCNSCHDNNTEAFIYVD